MKVTTITTNNIDTIVWLLVHRPDEVSRWYAINAESAQYLLDPEIFPPSEKDAADMAVAAYREWLSTHVFLRKQA